ncbi:unnamed protein product, partial [Staurois parvus]
FPCISHTPLVIPGSPDRGELTFWKLGHCRGPGDSRGPHELPLVPFS